MPDPQSMERLLRHLWADPVLFVEEILHAKPNPQQREILAAIAPNMEHPERGKRVAVKSGHGIGKSTVEAWVLLQGLSCCLGQIKIPITAPKHDNITKITLWPEVDKWLARMEPEFRRRIRKTAEKICIVGREESAYAFPMVAPADNSESMQGVHADNVLFLADEASGIPARVWPAIEGSLTTPGARLLVMANPTRADGEFYDAFHGNRALWKTLSFSSEDCEMTDKALLKKWENQYGRDSNFYRVRVLGDFPKASADQLIELSWLESACGREAYSPHALVKAGLDVARFGDDMTAFVLRRGNEVIFCDRWSGNDTMQTCGRVLALRKDHHFDSICVDSIGVGGGVADRLRELGVPTIDVNVSESPAYGDKFPRLRDELWWKAREFFQGLGARIDENIALKDDLIGQLSIARYSYTSDGKVKAEGKAEMKKRGVQSPDVADAFCLTLAEGDTATTAHGAGRTPVEQVAAGYWGAT